MSSARLDPEHFEVTQLDESEPLPPFTCGDIDLDEFLRDDALRLHQAGVTRVYLAWYENELIGYAAVLASEIKLKTNDVKKLEPLAHDDFHVIPGIKIGRLAVSAAFKSRHCGTRLVQLVADLAEECGENFGCRLLIVDAYRTSVEFYHRLGFRMRQADIDDTARITVPMWLDLQQPRDWS
jgi:GNAT superfamily N-acetyltransferase